MNKKNYFNLRTIKYLAVVLLAGFVIIKLGFCNHKTDETQKSAKELQKLIDKDNSTKLEVALAKEKLNADIEKANNYKEELDKTLEFVLATSKGSASKKYDANPDGYAFMNWGFQKDITVFTDYHSKYILNSKKLTSYVEDDAIVSIVYNPDDIYVFTKIDKTSVDENTGLFKSSFSKSELLAIQELLSDEIDKYLLNKKENITASEKVLKNYLVKTANKYGVSQIRVNGEMIDTSSYISSLSDNK